MAADPYPGLEYETMIFGRHVLSAANDTVRENGPLDYSAYILLSLFHTTGPISIGELSEITGRDASTLNRQTAALLRKGLAERIADPAGGMARKFRNTPVGEQALAEVRAAAQAQLAEVVTDWDTTDLATFTELLGRLNRDIEKQAGRPWPRD